MKAVLLTSSVLILILIALRYLLRGRISLRLQYALWLLVAVRLLVPVEVGKSQWSVLAIWQRMPFGSVAQAVENMGSRPVRAYSDAYAEVVEQYEAQGVDVSQLQGEALWAVDYEARALQKQGSTLAETAKILGKYVYGTGCGVIAVWFLGPMSCFAGGSAAAPFLRRMWPARCRSMCRRPSRRPVSAAFCVRRCI